MTPARVLPRLRFDGEAYGRGEIIADAAFVDRTVPISRVIHTSGRAAYQIGVGRRQQVVCLAELAGVMGRRVYDRFPNRAARRGTARRKP